ncbi:MAG: hypothetical protein HC875_39275 [Anaerolineales bacterium]|nr:hypothetical protein [Anaerolineales bacterium]
MGGDVVSGESNFFAQHNFVKNVRLGSSYQDLAYGIVYTSIQQSDMNPVNGYMRYNNVQNIPSWEAYDVHGGVNLYIQNNYAYNCCFGIATQAWACEGDYPDTLAFVYVENNVIEHPAAQTHGHVFFGATQATGSIPHNIYIRNNEFFFTELSATLTDCYDGILTMWIRLSFRGISCTTQLEEVQKGSIFRVQGKGPYLTILSVTFHMASALETPRSQTTLIFIIISQIIIRMRFMDQRIPQPNLAH